MILVVLKYNCGLKVWPRLLLLANFSSMKSSHFNRNPHNWESFPTHILEQVQVDHLNSSP